jgi:hypothetical protein
MLAMCMIWSIRGRSCRCQVCGHHWELPDPLNPEKQIHTCVLQNGTILFWDESRGSVSTAKPAKPIHRAPGNDAWIRRACKARPKHRELTCSEEIPTRISEERI